MSRSVRPVSIIMALCLIVLSGACVTADSEPANAAGKGKTYYVDSAGGRDTNAGTGKNSAWRTLDKVNGTTFQPGDRILFKAGATWTGQLWPKGSGTAGKPIIVDMYGSGAKPAIHGAGLHTETVKLFNQQYWEINNLELTNVGETRATRRAVWIEAQDIGVARHIHLKNLNIHDVNGQTEVQDLESGGIIVRVTGSATPTKFDDVLIQDNTFTDVDSTGIFVRSNWRNRATRTDGVGPWLGMTNVVIRGNSLNRTGGDAIIVCEGDGPLVERNVAANSYYDSVGYHAAIWAINSDDALFQYNEAFLTRNTLDGMGFDIDELCNNCVMQYNYSHDNEGGFMLLVGQRGGDGTGYDQNGIVRYNVSENDGTALIQAVGRMQNYQVYNNTFYTGPGMNVRFLMAPDGNNMPQGTLSFKNNIVYNLGNNMTYYCGNATCTFDSNTFYGNHDPSEPADPNKLTTDPGLIAPGTGGTGLATVDGYRLAAGSPSLGSGTPITGNVGKDYWGNAVSAASAPNRGAYNGLGVTAENVGGGIQSFKMNKDGKEFRIIQASEPTEATIKANKPLTVTDSEGVTQTYYPGKGNLLYFTFSDKPLQLLGDIKKITPGSKYSLEADDTYRSDDLPLVLKVDNTIAPRGRIDAKLAIGGREAEIRAAPGQIAEVALTIPGSDTAGRRHLVGDLVAGGKPFGRVTADVLVKEPLHMQVKHQLDGSGEALLITVRNLSDTARTIQDVTWTIGELSGTEAINAAVQAGAELNVSVPVTGVEPSTRYPVSLVLHAAGGLTLAYGGDLVAFTSLARQNIAIDGEPDDLAAIPRTELPRQGTIAMPGYGGPNDLSGDVWVVWDEQSLNLSVVMRDNAFSQNQSGGQIWLGDSVQFALTPGMPGDSTELYEFGMALTPEGPQLYRWTGIEQPAGLVTNAHLSVTRDEARSETRYELALPWSEVAPIAPEDGLFGLSLLVNDNDGTGRKGWIEWGGGIGGAKDPGQFLPVRLAGPVARTLESVAIPEPLAYSAIPLTLTLQGTYEDGFRSRITHAQWTTSDENVAAVANGLVTFTGNKGPVTITASYQGMTASVGTVVEELGQYYPFDEGEGAQTREAIGGIAYDIEGTPVWVDGKVGKALLFYGNSISISPVAQEDFTFMAWIKTETDSYNHHIVGQGVSGSQANMFNWWIANGQMYFLVSDSEGQGHGMWPFNTDAGSIPLGVWTHVAAVREGNEFRLYINGERVLSKTVGYHQNQLENPNPFRIGAQNSADGGPSEGFHGIIDEMRLYPEALTDGKIRQIGLGEEE